MPMPPTAGRSRRTIKIFLWLLVIVAATLLVKFILHLLLPRANPGSGEALELDLKSGKFQTLYYGGPERPGAILILGTGDGGWSYWEERVAKHVVPRGFAVGSWDCRKFADTRKFGAAELVEGFNAAVEATRERSRAADDCPVFYGGWSTGAEWSIAAAASPDREENLVGVLAAAPGGRSRYGITKADLLGFNPEGDGSFALASLCPALAGVCIVQFSAGLDPLDDTQWLAGLGKESPHKIVKIHRVLHDMGGAGDVFLQEFDAAADWCLKHRRH